MSGLLPGFRPASAAKQRTSSFSSTSCIDGRVVSERRYILGTRRPTFRKAQALRMKSLGSVEGVDRLRIPASGNPHNR